jgi:hypothetical protein
MGFLTLRINFAVFAVLGGFCGSGRPAKLKRANSLFCGESGRSAKKPAAKFFRVTVYAKLTEIAAKRDWDSTKFSV